MYVLCYHSPYITTGIYCHDLICIFLNKKAYQIKPIICMSLSVDHIPIGTVLLHRIHACILQFYHSSTPSSLDRLHMECIQAAHVLLIPLSLTHNSHYNLNSMSSIRSPYRQPYSSYHQSYYITLLSTKLSFFGHIFIYTYSFSLSVSLNPSFHDHLPTCCILAHYVILP